MDWSKGFSAKYFLSIVDPRTWRDIEHMDLTEGSISKEKSGLRESADISGNNYDFTQEKWVRIWLKVKQSDDSEQIPLFTGLVSCPTRKINTRLIETPMECYSVLKPAEDILLPRGYYVPVDTPSGKVIEHLLSVTPAPVVVEDNSPYLSQEIIAESGESNLSMVDRVLDAIGWRLQIHGDGSIHAIPQSYDPKMIIGAGYDVIEPEVDITQDWFACPNVFRAVANGQSAVAKDESEDSMLSTVSRGREIWVEETDCTLNNDETLAEYAKRRLDDYQLFGTMVSYSRRFIPNIYPGDVVTLNYPTFDDLSMVNYLVESQSISLGKGAAVSESASRI